jgi:predicted metalloprotease
VAGCRVGGPATTLLACVAAFGCGGSPAGPADLDGDGLLDDLDECPRAAETPNGLRDADGCPDTPGQFYLSTRSDVESFWTGNHPQTFSRPYAALASFGGYSPPFGTPCGTLRLEDAMYCPSYAAVYFDTGFLESLLGSFGDVGPAFVISHEIGHNVGWGLGWTPYLSAKLNELQADCFAGAWVRDADDRGFLETEDLDRAVADLVVAGDAGSPWFDPAGHGTSDERVTSFSIGYDGGPFSCVGQAFIDVFP